MAPAMEILDNRDSDTENLLRQIVLHGVKLKILPGHLFLLEDPGSASKTAFVHSVAITTRLSTVTFVLQKRFRRAIHQRKGIPLPKGATFSFFSMRDPVKYANKIGYPVVIKEVFGENPSFSVYNINNKKELLAAVEKVQAHLPTSGLVKPSSYAQTINLSTAEVSVNGGRKKSEKARFLVEKQLLGDCYRSYVIGGKHVAAVEVGKKGSKEVVVPPEIRELSEQAVSAISGLQNATVYIVKDREAGLAVTELSERIVLPSDLYGPEDVVGKIFFSLLLSETEKAGIKLRRKRQKAEYEITFGGVAESGDVFSYAEKVVANHGGEVALQSDDKVSGRLTLSLKGSAEAVVKLALDAFENYHLSNMELVRKKGGLLGAWQAFTH